MANLAQMVNAIAPIVTTGDAAAVQPIYYPFLLHARAALDAAADVHVDGPVISPQLPRRRQPLAAPGRRPRAVRPGRRGRQRQRGPRAASR